MAVITITEPSTSVSVQEVSTYIVDNPALNMEYFAQLKDTPNSFTGKGTQAVTVKSDETGLEYTDYQTQIDSKADDGATTAALATKADDVATAAALATKADDSATTAALATKADDTATTAALATKADDAATSAALSSLGAQVGTKLNSSSYTANDVLAKIKTVDGVGSGLDAGRFDGLTSGQFLRSDVTDTVTGLITIDRAGEVLGIGDDSLDNTDAWIRFGNGGAVDDLDWLIKYQGSTTGATGNEFQVVSQQYQAGFQIDHLGNFDVIDAGGTHKVWHAGNDGPGSGLNADLLDGVNGGSYMRSDATDSFSGDTLNLSTATKLRLHNQNDLELGSYNHAFQIGPDSSANLAIDINEIAARNNGGAATLMLNNNGGDVLINGAGNTVWHQGNDGDLEKLSGDQTITGTKTFTTGPVINSHLKFEDGDHRITYNDGGGNFNIRAGNEYSGGTVYTNTGGAIQIALNHESVIPEIVMHLSAAGIGNTAGTPVSFTKSLWMKADGTFTWGGDKIYHAGNDGSGSGLDADTLDGYEATDFVQDSAFSAALATKADDGATSAALSSLSAQIGTKLNSSSYTASDVLTKIKTVDGSGSGLDADKLDGQEGSYYYSSANPPPASAPSTSQVGTATAGLAAGAVGTYLWGGRVSGVTTTYGATYAGSDIRGDGLMSSTSSGGYSTVNRQNSTGPTQTGTWRAMGQATTWSGYKTFTLFLRIA